MKSRPAYLPAQRFHALTALYDPLVRWATREATFKRALLEQARIEAGHKVLDLGCGTGTLAVAMARAHPDSDIWAVDADPAMLARTRAKAERAGVQLTGGQAMADRLPFGDACFDRVLSSLLFHHLLPKEKRCALGEIRRILKPGGELLLADWNKPTNPLLHLGAMVVRLVDGFERTAEVLSGKLPELITEAGLHQAPPMQSFATPLGRLTLYRARR